MSEILTKEQVEEIAAHIPYRTLVDSHELLRAALEKTEADLLEIGKALRINSLGGAHPTEQILSRLAETRKAVDKAVGELVAFHCVLGTFCRELSPHVRSALDTLKQLQAALASEREGDSFEGVLSREQIDALCTKPATCDIVWKIAQSHNILLQKLGR